MGEIIMWVSRYLMAGVILTLMFDWLITKVNGEGFTNGERIAVIIFWPLMCLAFVWGWITGFNK